MALFLSRYWAHLAVILAAIAIVFLIYSKGAADTKARLELASVQSELVEAQRLRSVEQKAYTDDATRAAQAQDRLSALTDQIDELSEYAANLEDANRECLAPADTERMRNLWK